MDDADRDRLNYHSCAFCGADVPYNDYSDDPTPHDPKCPVREMMEVRLMDQRRENEMEEDLNKIAQAVKDFLNEYFDELDSETHSRVFEASKLLGAWTTNKE